jgi:dTDP-4-amino-4,6-dideoxygalactose transaminase
MPIFNSLGSNYSWNFALKALLKKGSDKETSLLAAELSTRFGGTAYLTYKGREAIALALQAAKLPQGAKVVVPGYTCATVVVAVTNEDCVPVYADIQGSDVNFNAKTFEALIQKHTDIKAVLVQNTLGVPCDIDAIRALCDSHKIILIEDLAHSVGGTYANGVEMGTRGDFVILSFSQDKIIDAVSGGSLIIRNQAFSLPSNSVFESVPFFEQVRARMYPVATCFIRATYKIGLGKLVHRILFSLHLLAKPVQNLKQVPVYKIPNWCAALARERFQELSANISHRQEIVKRYLDILGSRSELGLVNTEIYHHTTCLRLHLVVDNRDDLVAYLRTKGIHLSDIWYDVPVAPKRFWYLFKDTHDAKGAQNLAQKSFNLPTHQEVTPAVADHIANHVITWLTSPHNTSPIKTSGTHFS